MTTNTQNHHRHDGRVSFNQLRDSVLQRSCHSRSDGSALWRQGNTAVLACVYGPRAPSSMASEDPERCIVEVAWRPRSGGAPGPRERSLEAAVARCAQGALLSRQHPRCAVLVALQVLSDDGGVLACGINAACAAMVDAGLPMAFIFGAVACAFGVGGGGAGDAAWLLLDPDADEEAKAAAVLVAAYPYRAVLEEVQEAAAAGGEASEAEQQQNQKQQRLCVSSGALIVDLKGRAGDESLALGLTACRRGVESLASFAREVVAEGVAKGAGVVAAAVEGGGGDARSASKKAKKGDET